jgi:oligopeptide/dipeptide ABC transporter ATP-binding protein
LDSLYELSQSQWFRAVSQHLDLLRKMVRSYTQVPRIAIELCDTVVVMYAGEVVEQGSVHDIFHRPGHPYTRRLLTCDPARVAADAPGPLPTIPGDVPDLMSLPPGCVFAPRCVEAVARCHAERPPIFEIGSGHTARCHLLGPGGG